MTLASSVRMPLIVPDKMFVKFRWQVNANPTVAAGEKALCINTLWKPDATGTWFNPGEYRTTQAWGNFYMSYTVQAAKMRLKAINLNPDGVAQINVYPSDILAPVHGGDDTPPYIEAPYSKWRLLGPANGGNNMADIKYYISIKKIFGCTGTKIRDDKEFSAPLGSGLTADPVNKEFLMLATNASVSPQNIHFSITITAYALLWNRKENPQP